jgi:short-subunit dehydrogenase
MSQTTHAVILGATSDIAHATARLLAKQGYQLTLVARNQAKLDANAQDLKARGAASVEVIVADFTHQEAAASVAQKITFPVSLLILAHGVLGDQTQLLTDAAARTELYQVNTLSYIECLSQLIAPFQEQKSGQIVIISSVAADRVRQSNFFYGSSKAAVSAFASGLRNYLYPAGVHVMTVHPGFVATAMTAHLDQGPLFAEPKSVARDILRGLDKGRNVLYTPFFWRYIMLVIRSIPEFVFKRLKL